MDENKLLEKINKLEKEIKIQDRNLVKLTQALPKIIKNICTHVYSDEFHDMKYERACLLTTICLSFPYIKMNSKCTILFTPHLNR